MGDNRPKNPVQLDTDLEREIREGRKFSVAEAIGRLAGPGMMKGVSPATQKQQAEAALESFLERHLNSPAGALSVVLFRQIKESQVLLANLEQPLAALATFVRQVLDSEYRLQELVRESDVEWGRVYGERPLFQKEGCQPEQDDPYTVESVRATLTKFAETLAAAKEHSTIGRDSTAE
jgi:hypothetical protein